MVDTHHFAAQKGHYNICKIIIDNVDEKNPSIHDDGSTPLFIAAANGHRLIFKLIFESLASDNNKNPRSDGGYTPLHIAASKGHLEICQIILEEVDDKNPVTDDGFTPLYLAANNGHLEVFNFIERVSSKNSQTTPKCCQHTCPTNTTEMSISGWIWSTFKNLWK